MDEKIVFAVVLGLFAQANFSGACLAAENYQANKPGCANSGSYKLAQAKPEDKAGPAREKAAPAATPVNNAGSSTDKPAAAGAASPAAAQKAAEPEDPAFNEHLSRGVSFFNQNKLDDALTEFNKALELGKYNTAVRNWLGAVYQRKNDHEKAAAIYEEVVDLDPGYPEAHNNLGYSYQMLEKYPEAEKEYARALELKPALIEARFNLACVLQLEQKYEDSTKEFEIVLKADPARTDCYLHLGEVARESKDFDKALLYYNKALDELKKQDKKDPQARADILGDIAIIDKEKGDKSKAKEELEKVLDLDPGSYKANLYLGIIAFEDKDFTACVNYLGKALERNPYDAAVHYWLGKYYYSLDSLKNSIKQFEDCLKCDATEHKFPDCQEWLDKAKKRQATF